MSGDTTQMLLGNGAVTLIIIALVQFVQKVRDNKTTLRTSYETREQARYVRDSDWNDKYRSAAEKHMQYDIAILGVVTELRTQVQILRKDQGLEPAVFTVLPIAPPLFP